ncbi:MAG TPA: TIM barrel protein [Chthoniobacteraceae bacterium]|nr:TIM barrel protein [Chthoniobacteraceae bacterium]
MKPIKQSVSLPMFRKREPDQKALIHLVRELGFDGIELWGRKPDFEAIAGAAREAGLEICAMVATSTPLNDPALHEKAQQEIDLAIRLAADHGVANLICFSGPRREGAGDPEGVEAIATAFRRVAPLAEERGVTLLLELLNSKVDHPGYQADHTPFGVAVCQRVASPRVRLLYDIYHMQIMEGDLIRTLTENLPYIGHFHTAGNPGRHEPDASQEINYRAIAAALHTLDYDGYVGHEFSPCGDFRTALREAKAIFDREL